MSSIFSSINSRSEIIKEIILWIQSYTQRLLHMEKDTVLMEVRKEWFDLKSNTKNI